MAKGIERLLRINLELEGALRVAAQRVTPETQELLIDKYNAFCEAVRDCFPFVSAAEPAAAESAPSAPAVEPQAAARGDGAAIDEPQEAAAVMDDKPTDAVDQAQAEVKETIEVEQAPAEVKEAVAEVDQAPVEVSETADEAGRDSDVVEEAVAEMEDDTNDPAEDESGKDAPADAPAGADAADVDDDDTLSPEPAVKQSLADVLSQRNAKDLTRAFTINDKFRFIRGLFCEDKNDFEYTVMQLSMFDSLDEAYDYLLNELGWDIDNDEVKAFLTIVANHFNAM